MIVYILAASNSEGCCRPEVFDSKEKAVKGLKDAYELELEGWVDENGKLIEDDEEANPIQDYGINPEVGYAYVQYEDNEVHFEIFEEVVK